MISYSDCFFIFCVRHLLSFFFFFFNDTATTEIYTLSLHDALPISSRARYRGSSGRPRDRARAPPGRIARTPSAQRRGGRYGARRRFPATCRDSTAFL